MHHETLLSSFLNGNKPQNLLLSVNFQIIVVCMENGFVSAFSSTFSPAFTITIIIICDHVFKLLCDLDFKICFQYFHLYGVNGIMEHMMGNL